jgi:hypothetical protein
MMTLIGFEVKEFETNQLPHCLKSRLQVYLDLGGAHALEKMSIDCQELTVIRGDYFSVGKGMNRFIH